MKTKVTRSRVTKFYRLAVEDGEVRDKPYSTRGAQYRVEGIEVTKGDGNVKVVLFGPVLKKDGTDSLVSASETFYSSEKWPNWLRRVVGGLA